VLSRSHVSKLSVAFNCSENSVAWNNCILWCGPPTDCYLPLRPTCWDEFETPVLYCLLLLILLVIYLSNCTHLRYVQLRNKALIDWLIDSWKKANSGPYKPWIRRLTWDVATLWLVIKGLTATHWYIPTSDHLTEDINSLPDGRTTWWSATDNNNEDHSMQAVQSITIMHSAQPFSWITEVHFHNWLLLTSDYPNAPW